MWISDTDFSHSRRGGRQSNLVIFSCIHSLWKVVSHRELQNPALVTCSSQHSFTKILLKKLWLEGSQRSTFDSPKTSQTSLNSSHKNTCTICILRHFKENYMMDWELTFFFLIIAETSQSITKIGIKKSPSVCMNTKKKTKIGMHFCGCVKNIT